jgi:branched-subunit amino acid transport protein
VTTLLVIASISLGTYFFRAIGFVALGNRALSTRVEASLALVAPAAVGALVASMAFTEAGRIDVAPVAELIAIGAGFLAVRRSGNVMHAFAVGLPVFWVISLLAT